MRETGNILGVMSSLLSETEGSKRNISEKNSGSGFSRFFFSFVYFYCI